MANREGGTRIVAGRENKQREEARREQGEEDTRGELLGYTASHRESKVYRNRERQSPQAKVDGII